MVKIALYIDGLLMDTRPIEFQNFNGKTFQEQVELRQDIVNAEVKKLKEDYADAVEWYDWRVIIGFESKMEDENGILH